tara:strand:+ start:2302 stop:2742 length:441 start_codon:yes stop_codon:yes gene_type:complete
MFMNEHEVPNQAYPTLAAWAVSPPVWDEICNPTMMWRIAAEHGNCDYYMADPVFPPFHDGYGPTATLIVLRNMCHGIDAVAMIDEGQGAGVATKFVAVIGGGEPMAFDTSAFIGSDQTADGSSGTLENAGEKLGAWIHWIDGDHEF